MDFFRECPVSSPEQVPTLRSREDGFSGLIFERITDIENALPVTVMTGV
jgi:hypothetical protein